MMDPMNTDDLANETWDILVDPLSWFSERRRGIARRIHDEVEEKVFIQVNTDNTCEEIIDQFGSANRVWR
jgi:hypothetical protein